MESCSSAPHQNQPPTAQAPKATTDASMPDCPNGRYFMMLPPSCDAAVLLLRHAERNLVDTSFQHKPEGCSDASRVRFRYRDVVMAAQAAGSSLGKRPRHTTRYALCHRTTSSTNAQKVREPPSGQRSRGILKTSQAADDLFSIAFPASGSPPEEQICAIIRPSSSTLSSTFTGRLTATNPAPSGASAQTRSKDKETLGSPTWLILIVSCRPVLQQLLLRGFRNRSFGHDRLS